MNLKKRIISLALVCSIAVPQLTQFKVAADETEKFQYTMFGRNGITMSVSSNLCMNGNLHTNKDAAITATNKNINGKLTTSADIEKRVKHVYADRKIYDTYFATNCELHEEEYVYSDINIHINNPLYCYSNITLDGNVSLNSSLGTLMNINITGEVKNANNSVVYSKYGNITIENDSVANVNGLIYAPLGTVTINASNVNLNGVIIADQIVINGSSVNINCNDNIARFIGTTSEYYDYSGLEYLPEEWLGDTDADDLFDIYEKVIDSDPLNPDTDGDGLFDGYEILTLNTDPLEIDTDGNGVLDGNEDFDTDNLVNIDEYNNQTLPFTPDTDEDGFVDGDEVHIYGTIPTNPDTDGDNLLDGEESYDGSIYLEHGVYFDPLNPDTDGDGVADGDEVFGQTKEQVVQTQDEAINEVIVDMETNGNIDRNLTVESMQGIDAMTSNVYALVGEPFNFETESDFESATITFKIDQSKLGDTQFDNLLILWYNEEKQIFEEMPTTHDAVNSTVSTTTTHFSQYMVVDSEKWFDHWEENIWNLNDEMWIDGETITTTMNTIFLIDCSNAMELVDPIDYQSIELGYNGVTADNYSNIINDMANDVNYYQKNYGRRQCNRAEICESIINKMVDGDKAIVMTFSDDIETRMYWSSNRDFLINGDYLTKGGEKETCGVQRVNNDGGQTNLKLAISEALEYVEDSDVNKYRIIVLSHSGAEYAEELSDYNYDNVSLNIVNLGPGYVSPELEMLVKQTYQGDVYNAVTASQLTTQVGGSITMPPIFNDTDSDEDTIPDFVEKYGLQPNGEPINTRTDKKDSDGDGIDDNVELGYVPFSTTFSGSKEYLSHFTYRSDPSKPDTDEDGLNDGKTIEYNGELIAPVDPNPRQANGLNNMWKTHIENVKRDTIPSMLGGWLGETQPVLENTGVEGMEAMVEEFTYLVNNDEFSEIDIDEYLENTAALLNSGSIEDSTEFSLIVKDVFNIIRAHIKDADKEDYIMASLGSRFLNFKLDNQNEALHSQLNTWQIIGGYNDAYDSIFKEATNGNMRNEKFSFALNDDDYIFWMWKGDYLNIGAGAEIGIYKRDSDFNTGELDHYFASTDLAMPMELYLYNYENSENINNIFSWNPETPQWWVTGFNPDYINNVDVAKQVVVGKMEFTGREDMYDAYVAKYRTGNELSEYVVCDDEHHTVWVVWG